MPTATHRDALWRWTQAGDGRLARMVRITALQQANRYTARPIEIGPSGQTQFVGEQTLTVTNLAESAGGAGTVPADTDALAIDAGGRWIVWIRPAGSSVFPARVLSAAGGALYTVRQQVATGNDSFADAPGAADLTACNLAELFLGDGGAVDDETIVLVTVVLDNASPPAPRYVFDHPAYAKYLE